VTRRICAKLEAGLERSLARDITVAALVERYREAMSDIESAIAMPAVARRGHSMRRASKFMREHLGEPLSLASVARIAGFAPNRFSKLFKQTYRTTYERYLLRLRVDCAKQVLCTTSIGVEAVGEGVTGTRESASRAHSAACPHVHRSALHGALEASSSGPHHGVRVELFF
jgi:transcriptional regulator GlxA family with amidase domain